MVPYSLYLHIPFCRHRCGYCDFNTYAGLEALVAPYVQALCAEIATVAEAGKRWQAEHTQRQAIHAGQLQAQGAEGRRSQAGRLPAHTAFFGGGTPSLLPVGEVERILTALRAAFDLLPGAEITLEANPGTLSLEYLRDLRSLGVNRLSLGVQSAHPGELALLERGHTYPDVIRSVSQARRAGFDNLNLDLIFGLPEQELQTWQRSLELALGLEPEHFSLYALSLEHGTPFGQWAGRGLLSQPDPDRAADMYEWASERLERAGYAQYEISNWARFRGMAPGVQRGEAHGDLTGNLPGNPSSAPPEWLTCRHNLQYWRNLPYLGLGAGAHGYAAGVRTANTLAPAAYIQRLQAPAERQAVFPASPAAQSVQPVDREAEIGETMMMGLRLVEEGVSNRAFAQRFGQTLSERFEPQITRLQGQGLLEWAGPQNDRLRLTRYGRLLGNRVFVEFI